ncbi:MAG: glycosyltransferase family 2 protein [Burkholderiales bacterium]|nr:glycosyltransferase family 2 protein [Burkholderiales bacterium]
MTVTGPGAAEAIDVRSAWIVIAAYNEAEHVGEVVQDLRQRYPNIVVVDDGSSDATGDRARDAGAIVVRHMVNLGQGAAVQTGISFALRRGACFIVTFDADGQHASDDVARLLAPLHDGQADIVCGSRFLGATIDAPPLRRPALRLAALLTRLTTGLRVTDAHNGLRAMTRNCAQQVRIRQDRMAHASEIVREVARLRLRLSEVPVTIRYTEYSLRKGQGLLSGLRILFDLLLSRLYR